MTEVTALARFVAAEGWSILPAFAVSIALGALIRALQLDGLVRRVVGARIGLAVVLATAVGAFSPLCACTVVPVINGLLYSGVPLAPVMSFWIASPTMDPEKFALTVSTMGWPLAVARMVATLILSLGAGYLTIALTRGGLLGDDVLRRRPSAPAAKGRLAVIAGGSSPEPATSSCCAPAAPAATSCCAAAGPASAMADSSLVQRLRAVHWPTTGRQMAAESWRLGKWLLLAFLLEAIIVRHVPQAAIVGLLGEGSRFAVVLAALVGIPLYLNNVAALPIVSGLLTQGMQPGAAIAFLIAGPVTTVPAMSAVWGVVTRRVFALYLGVSLVGAVVLGWITDLVLG
ncbi:MAG TPA: permease [Methylomirabilota bacterium]|nr:permease [Methylomirabilota bacterium]